MQAYRTLPDESLLKMVEVELSPTIAQIISRPGVRVNCAICGEEVLNEREVEVEGLLLCRSCAGSAYYHERATINRMALNLRSA
jgi:formylmethanofuran dehydrogenase subunit E